LPTNLIDHWRFICCISDFSKSIYSKKSF